MSRRLIVPVALSLLAITAVTAIAADPPPVASASGPSPVAGQPGLPELRMQALEQEIASKVGELIQREHYSRSRVDDALSSDWLDRYLEELDPGRVVFLQGDIDEFEAFRHTLDDALLARPNARLEPGLVIYERYRLRMAERSADAKAIAAGPVDLTNAEVLVPDRKEAGLGWPATAEEARELWRQRVEDEYIRALLPGQDEEEEVRQRLVKRYERYAKTLSQTESADVLESWLGALTRSVDPHSVWWKPVRSEDFNVDITNSVEGIGAQLTSIDGVVTIDSVVAGGPAEQSKKLRAKDRILAVAQGGGEPVDVVEMRLDHVVKMIRGPKGTEVRLTVEHADTGEREIVALVRDRVMLERAAAEGRVEEVEGRKLGYLRLPSFYVPANGSPRGRSASNDLRARIEEVKTQGVEGMVLDLRGNGGGSLSEAVLVAGLFLPGGPVVQVRDPRGSVEALHDADRGAAWTGPLVVLVDATSASASEIVAGALQDYGRAVVVGDRSTHGKGTVQQVIGLTPQLRGRHEEGVGGDLKLTIQKFYRVSGGSTQNRGVESDIPLPSIWDGVEFVHEADLPHAMTWDSVPPAPHVRTADLSSVLPALRAASEARVAASEDFARLAKMVAQNEADEARQDLSLVLEERRREYEERKALADAGGDPAEIADGELPEVEFDALPEEEREAKLREQDYRLDEGLLVLRDLVAALGAR